MSIRPLGFHSGMSQTSAILKLALPYFETVDDEGIREFLENGFGIETERCVFERASGISEDYTMLLSHLAALSMDLLQGVKLPVFEPFHFLRVARQKDGGRVEIVLRVPFVDYMSSGILKMAVGTAFQCLRKILQEGNSGEVRARLFERIETEYVEKVKPGILAGGSTIPMLRAAYRAGIPFFHLGAGVYQLGVGSAAVLIDRSITEKDTAISARLTGQKLYTSRILGMAGLPVPQQVRVADEAALAAAAEEIGFPVVVKPSDRERGEGITIGIVSQDDLIAAYKLAREMSNIILVEKHIPGVCHRVTIVDGDITHIVRRDPRHVVGNGTNTVAELIEMNNAAELLKPKYKRRSLMVLDDTARIAIEAAGYATYQIPEEGQTVSIRDIESTEFGGEAVVFTDTIHPENAKLAMQAAKILKMSTSGVDIISEDITVPWYENGAVINEMNFSPSWGDRLDYMRRGRERFLEKTFPTQGRIPVHVFVGDAAARQAAEERHAAEVAGEKRSFLVCGEGVFGPLGERRLAIEGEGVFLRARALRLQEDVDEMVLVVSSTELLETGLPVDRIDSVTVINEAIALHRAPARQASASETAAVIGILEKVVLREDDRS